MTLYIPVLCEPAGAQQHLFGYQIGDPECHAGYVFIVDKRVLFETFDTTMTINGIEGWKCDCLFLPPLAFYDSFEEAEEALNNYLNAAV